MADKSTGGPWWSHAVVIIIGLGLWFWTQNLIGELAHEPGTIGDTLHNVLDAPNTYLQQHKSAATLLLVSSSAVIDLLGVTLLFKSIFGNTLRPFLGMLILFGMRQACQLLMTLDQPIGMIWFDPGFPSLLVTYHVASDFFFSGHTGIAVLGAIELYRTGNQKARWIIIGAIIAVFEMFTVLVLRAHYTMDVFTGAIAALLASILSARCAPAVDSLLAKLFGPEQNPG